MPKASSHPTLANLANVLGALATLVSDEGTSSLAARSLVESDQVAILLVSKYPGCSIEQLRAPLQLSHSGCVRLVDRLVEQGLVERERSDDGRAVSLRLTRQGRTAAAGGRERREESLTHLVSVLDADERDALFAIANKLLRAGAPTERVIGRTCRACDYKACTRCPFHGFVEPPSPRFE